jgi:hypothetical protein
MTEEQRRNILVETVKVFGRQEWFRDATVYEKDAPENDSGETLLEFKVNYVPLFEKKEVIKFAQVVNLAYRFKVIDRQGKPIQ